MLSTIKVTAPAPATITGPPLSFDLANNRVNIIPIAFVGTAANVEIITQPTNGHVSVRDNANLNVILTRNPTVGTSSVTYRVTRTNGSQIDITSTVEVTASVQVRGWGLGNHYLLETDGSDRVVTKKAASTRVYYITAGANGWTPAEIEAAEALTAGTVTVTWVKAQTKYGGQSFPLDAVIGFDVIHDLYPRGGPARSDWILLERGYDYTSFGTLTNRGSAGLRAIHPIVFGAWGTGTRPIVFMGTLHAENGVNQSYIVYRDLATGNSMGGLGIHKSIFEGCEFLHENSFQAFDTGLEESITVRYSYCHDVRLDAPRDGRVDWSAHADRVSGFFCSGTDGTLWENNVFAYIGWEEGFHPTSVAGTGPSSPNLYSHNIYMQDDTYDLTWRRNLSSRSSSFGAQFRGGVFLEDSLFIENPAAMNTLGGDYLGAGPVGNTSLLNGAIVCGALARENPFGGARGWGIQDEARGTIYRDTIVANGKNKLIDQAYKDAVTINTGWKLTHYALDNVDLPHVYNWGSDPNQNIEGLNTATLDTLTVQTLASNLALPTATVAAFDEYFGAKALAYDFVDDFKSALNFWRTGFGIPALASRAADTNVFIPLDGGDGVRSDNRLNWSLGSIPQTGDTIDLKGNDVNWGGTVSIANLIFGKFGKLRVTYGKLTAAAMATAGTIRVTEFGELEVTTSPAALTLDADSGLTRFMGNTTGGVNVACREGIVMLARNGQSFTVNGTLSLTSPLALVGYDGAAGTATIALTSAATLSFTATAAGFGKVGRAWTGCYATSDASGTITLGGAKLSLDLTALVGNGSWTLVQAETITGTLTQGTITGLGSRDLSIVVSGTTVVATLTTGTGVVTIS